MASWELEGYQLVDNGWKLIPAGDLVLSEPKGTESPIIVQTPGRRVFYHQVITGQQDKTPYWVRATFNEDRPNELQWSLLAFRSTAASWKLVLPYDPLLATLNALPHVFNLLQNAIKVPLQVLEKADVLPKYNGKLDPYYQNIILITLEQGLNKPINLSDADWQIVLKAALFTHSAREEWEKIQKRAALIKAYQEIAIYLDIKNFKRYFSDSILEAHLDLPKIGDIYHYVAWTIFALLKDKTGLVSPALSDEAIANKTVGELIHPEQLVFTGLDDVQRKVMTLLLSLFDSFAVNSINTYEQPLKSASIIELKALIEIYNKHRILMPLEDWHAEIWNDFVMIKQQDMPYEEFSEKLSLFKKEEINSEATTRLYEVADMMKNICQEIDTDDMKSVINMIMSNSGIAVMGSLPRQQIETIINSDKFLDAIINFDHSNANSLLNSLHLTMPRDLWDVFVSTYPIHILMTVILENRISTPTQFYSYIVNILPEKDRCSFLLSDKILMMLNNLYSKFYIGSMGSFAYELTVGLKNISLHLFTECMLDQRYIELIKKFVYMIPLGLVEELRPRDRLKSLEMMIVFQDVINSRDKIPDVLRILPASDHIQFLSSSCMLFLKTPRLLAKTKKPVCDIVDCLSIGNKQTLFNSADGKKILMSLVMNDSDFKYMITHMRAGEMIDFALQFSAAHCREEDIYDDSNLNISVCKNLPIERRVDYMIKWIQADPKRICISLPDFKYNNGLTIEMVFNIYQHPSISTLLKQTDTVNVDHQLIINRLILSLYPDSDDESTFDRSIILDNLRKLVSYQKEILEVLRTIPEDFRLMFYNHETIEKKWGTDKTMYRNNIELLKVKLPPNVIDNFGNTSLHIAAQMGQVNVVKALLFMGEDPNVRNNELKTPLYLAAQGWNNRGVILINLEGHRACIEALIAAWADVDAPDSNGQTPLCVAAAFQHLPIVELLLKEKADVNKSPKNDRIAPLHWAAINGDIAIVTLFMEANALYSRDLQHNTPLHYAAMHGHADVVELLLNAGAPSNDRNIYGTTPLQLAEEGLESSRIEGREKNIPCLAFERIISLLKAADEKANTNNTAAPTGALVIHYGPGYMQNNATVSRASSASGPSGRPGRPSGS